MIRISDDWKGKVGIFRIIDIVNPLDVLFDAVGRKTERFGVAVGKCLRELRRSARLGGTDWRKVRRVVEKENPAFARPFVKVDIALSCRDFKIGCRYVAFSETPCLILLEGKKGVFNNQRSTRDPSQGSK